MGDLMKESLELLQHYTSIAAREGELGAFDAVDAVSTEIATLRAEVARVTLERDAACQGTDPASYPECVRLLGAMLADLLDSDDWNNVEPMLHAIGAALTAQLAAERELVRKAMWDEVRPLLEAEGCDCGAERGAPHECFAGMMEAALLRALPAPEAT